MRLLTLQEEAQDMEERIGQLKLQLSQADRSEAGALAELLNSIPGFHATVLEGQMVFRWDETVYRKYARHNGGRKAITVSREIAYTGGKSMKDLLRLQEEAVYTCSDICQMQKTGLTAEQIAEQIGLSRASYFRRIKAHREAGDLTEASTAAF